MPARPLLVITFHKGTAPRRLAHWDAVRRTGGRVTGGHMPIGKGVIPHDMAHLAVEAHFRIEDGFWGLLAKGASFKRGTRARPTNRGRDIVRSNRLGLHAAEVLGNAHHGAWVGGEATPVAPLFDRLAAQWSTIPDGGTLTMAWPTLDLVAAP